MRNHLYKLDSNHNPVLTDEGEDWAHWFESANRIVQQQWVGNYYVSTVFLGIDHNFSGSGAPILFETMVFSDGDGIETHRCCTWDEALAMHELTKARLLERENSGR